MGIGAFLVLAGIPLLGFAALSGNKTLILRKYSIMDQQGFQMEVLRLLVPKDWQVRGGVTWNYQSSPRRPKWRLQFPAPTDVRWRNNSGSIPSITRRTR